MARGIGKSGNRKKEVGFYIQNVATEIVNNEELLQQLADTEDDLLKADITDKLIRNNLRSIHAIIHRRYGSKLQDILQRNRMTYDDLYALGYEVLLRAIEKFDITLGYKFNTLLYTMYHNAYSKYFSRLKTPDSNVSLETPVYSDAKGGEDITLLETLPLEAEDIISQVSDTQFILALFDELEREFKPRDMAILRTYIGGEISQKELGKKYGVSQVQVGRIVKRIQAKAREIRDRVSGEVV